MNRAETFNLLLTHARALHCTLDRVYSSYALQVSIGSESYRALILARSADYWQQRIHLHKHRPALVICSSHDTCVPCSVLALDEGYLYEPCELPHWYTPEKRATARGSLVLLGQLLSGDESGFALINSRDFPRSTRYRYLAKMRRFLQNKNGRPFIT